MAELTHSTDKVLCILYDVYLKRRKNGLSINAASDFEYDIHLSDKRLLKIGESDFSNATAELNDVGYIKKYIDGSFNLTPTAIVDLENRFKNGAKDVLNFLTNLL